MTTLSTSSFTRRPHTRLGWWAVGIFILFVLLFIVNAIVFIPAARGEATARWVQVSLPNLGIFLVLSGLAAGILGLIAIIKQRERSWLVWLAILPSAFILLLLLGDLLLAH
jgi:cytochrome bd-type quinol oxidase subunit 2